MVNKIDTIRMEDGLVLQVNGKPEVVLFEEWFPDILAALLEDAGAVKVDDIIAGLRFYLSKLCWTPRDIDLLLKHSSVGLIPVPKEGEG